MSLSGSIIVFVMLWWIILFMLLPIGVRREEQPTAGHAASAPKNPNIAKKMLITTFLALLATLALFGLSSIPGITDWLNLRPEDANAQLIPFESSPY